MIREYAFAALPVTGVLSVGVTCGSPGALIVGALCFAAGYLTAALTHKVKETRMVRDPSRLGRFYVKIAPVLILFCVFSVIFANVGVFWLNAKRSEDQTALINTNQKNAVVSCQNANESRHATLALWNFLFSLGDPNASAQQKADTAKIRDWIRMIYRDRDCADLSKKYPLPDPPVLGGK